jgi:hypothetical protein
MDELPKIVAAQLAKAVGNLPPKAVPHPDPDLLTAFLERSLSEHERVDVVGHLANCAACRDTIALAQPELEATLPVFVGKPAARGLLIRWGLFAACATLALTVVLRHPREERPATVALKRAPASEPSVPPALTAEADHIEPRVNSELSRAGKFAKLRARMPEPQPEPLRDGGARMEGNSQSNAVVFGAQAAPSATVRTDAKSDQLHSAVNGRASIPGAPVVVAPELDKKAAPSSAPSGNAVEAKQRVDQYTYTTSADKSSEAAAVVGGLVAGNAGQETAQAEVADKARAKGKDKDKDAKEELHASSAPIGGRAFSLRKSVRQAALWQLTAEGALQRSFDSGKGWESVSMGQPARLRVFALYGLHVWAGGNAGTLFHSWDGGDSFAPVIVKDERAALSGDIVVLEFVDAAHGRLETAGHEVWATSDSGQTWQKQ